MSKTKQIIIKMKEYKFRKLVRSNPDENYYVGSRYENDAIAYSGQSFYGKEDVISLLTNICHILNPIKKLIQEMEEFPDKEFKVGDLIKI